MSKGSSNSGLKVLLRAVKAVEAGGSEENSNYPPLFSTSTTTDDSEPIDLTVRRVPEKNFEDGENSEVMSIDLSVKKRRGKSSRCFPEKNLTSSSETECSTKEEEHKKRFYNSASSSSNNSEIDRDYSWNRFNILPPSSPSTTQNQSKLHPPQFETESVSRSKPKPKKLKVEEEYFGDIDTDMEGNSPVKRVVINHGNGGHDGLEEHFRRSLSKDSSSTIDLTGVDEHFSRSLGGEAWKKLQKTNNSSSSSCSTSEKNEKMLKKKLLNVTESSD